MVSTNDLEGVLTSERLRVDRVRSDTRKLAMDPQKDYNSFDLMADISNATVELVRQTYNCVVQQIYPTLNVPGFAVFLYGSPSRGEMTSYSDIDLHIVDEIRTPESIAMKSNIIQLLGTFGFGKIDDPNWKNLETMKRYAAKSITEGNQIFDAKYVCGDALVREQLDAIRERHDTHERAVKNLFFQRFYLEHYYSNRSSAEIPNVKYCSGGYRELLTFDWFDRIMELSKNEWNQEDLELPKVLSALRNLQHNGIMGEDKLDKVLESVDFVVLLRNEMLHVNRDTGDEGITHLDNPTKGRLWQYSKNYFRSKGARKREDISLLFDEHSKIIRWTKNLLLGHVIAEETQNRGVGWRVSLDEIQHPDTPGFRRTILAEIDDELLQIASIWGAHYSQNPNIFAEIARKHSQNTSGEVQASLACSPLTPPEILHEIGTGIAREIGLEYILRIIGRNPSTLRKTLVDIAEDESLDYHYRKVAELNLKKGLRIATTRAS